MDTRGYVLVAGVLALVVVGVAVLAMAQAGPGQSELNGTLGTGSDGQPALFLVVLKGAEDSSAELARYEAGDKESITLQSDAHIRFECPDCRTPESMKVIAQDLSDGGIAIVRKSYDVNNEFFINLEKGNYQLRVQASWFDRGTYIYTYNISVA